MSTASILTLSDAPEPSEPAAPSCLVVLPTYQEAENIVSILRAVLDSPVRPDVLVVDDESPDGTADLAEAVAMSCPGRVNVLRRTGDRGLGCAYREGFAWALSRDYDLIAQMDADGSHPVARLVALTTAVAQGVDVAIGSRYVSGGAVENWPIRRQLLSRGGNLLARKLLHLAQSDVTGAYRVWSADALRACRVDRFTTNGYGFMIEAVAAMRDADLQVREVPITFRDRTAGSSKMSLYIVVETVRFIWSRRHRAAGDFTATPGWKEDPSPRLVLQPQLFRS